MKKDKQTEELIERFQRGIATPAEIALLEQCIEAGTVALEDVGDMDRLAGRLEKMDTPAPSANLDERFYAMLGKQPRGAKFFPALAGLVSWPQWGLRAAAALVLLLAGVGIGRYYVPAPAVQDNQVEMLSQQITDLREMMMLSLLEKDMATERLRAVHLTQEMTEVSTQVTQALLKTLNNDENVNVRLAALEALKPYARDSFVREELVRSIGRQDSPLVLVSLAELMAAIQEKSSVKEWQKILRDTNTPGEIKKRIKESIEKIS